MAIMATGDVFQSAQRCDTAIPIYDSVPQSSPIRRTADLQIAHCLQTLDKPDEAAAKVETVLNADPNDVGAAIELGNIYRANNEFAKAADAYTRGVDAMGPAIERRLAHLLLPWRRLRTQQAVAEGGSRLSKRH